MKKTGFDNGKYLDMQSEHIRSRIAQFGQFALTSTAMLLTDAVNCGIANTHSKHTNTATQAIRLRASTVFSFSLGKTPVSRRAMPGFGTLSMNASSSPENTGEKMPVKVRKKPATSFRFISAAKKRHAEGTTRICCFSCLFIELSLHL